MRGAAQAGSTVPIFTLCFYHDTTVLPNSPLKIYAIVWHLSKSNNHSKKILKVDRARRKEVAVKVRVKKDYSFRNEVRNLSAVALIIDELS